jgi:predicted AlkP superfamily phosphohydrolase/phosphomutase
MTVEPEVDRAFVLGLDGVPWRLVRRWTAAGELPHFEQLETEGITGSLESTQPMTTPVAWPSIATGSRPDEHGSYGFMELTPSHSLEINDRTDLQRPPLWEMVSPSVVGNVPMTYPPTPIDGKMVTGMITPTMDESFAYPPSLEERIRNEVPEYDVGLNWNLYRDRPDELLEDLTSLLEARRTVMQLLMETDNWQLFFFVYTAPDRLQHLFWDEDVLLDHYRSLDAILGEVMEYCSARNANLFVVSDHGFGPVSRTIHLNAILEQEGFLTGRDRTRTGHLLTDLGITKSGIERLIRAVGLSPKSMIDVLPSWLIDTVADSIPGDSVLYDIDHAQTSAFVHGPGTLYINDSGRFERGSVDPVERAELKATIASVFSKATDPETGARLVDVHDGDELFPADDLAPDLVLEPRAGYDLSCQLADRTIVDSDSKAGDHQSEGIFMAWGPDIVAGSSVSEATVFDVAPTVLHALGKPVPHDGHGHPLLEIFASDALSSIDAVTTAKYGQDGSFETENKTHGYDEVQERLRGLGYIK